MSSIHLIKKNDPNLPKILPAKDMGEDVLFSGDWLISKERAMSLIGGEIYFHRKKTAPAFLGGIIVKVGKSAEPGRFVFFFRPDPALREKMTPNEGWAMTMKYIV